MTGGGIDHFGVAGGRAEALAVVERAKVRAAFENLATDFDLRLAGIKAILQPRTAGVADRAAGLPLVFGGYDRLLAPPVLGPFPHIADHVVKAVAVGWVAPHGRGSLPAVLAGVGNGEQALPVIGQHLPVGGQLIAPGKFLALQPAARCQLVLGLGR